MRQATQSSIFLIGLLVALVGALGGQPAAASQGCPFDDKGCQEYCGQQGCNLGYCGHFAWIQCICRKCGDEWSWYDKVHYNPDKTVNQTELDSLKLNASAPLILTNNQNQQAGSRRQPNQQAPQQLNQQQQQQQQQQRQQQRHQQAATLTTLLIPDLSDGSRLNLNDIPDENSDKFLDYLAKNHERLVQATSSSASAATTRSGPQPDEEPAEDDDQAESALTTPQTSTGTGASSSSSSSLSSSGADDETVEIQISSSNNAAPARQRNLATDEPEPEQPAAALAPSGAGVARLLRMAVLERASDEID